MSDHLPNLDASLFDAAKPTTPDTHKPRILLLYGSTRERSFSRLLVEEAARLLEHFGAETRIFNRYSERKESAEQLMARVNQRSIRQSATRPEHFWGESAKPSHPGQTAPDKPKAALPRPRETRP